MIGYTTVGTADMDRAKKFYCDLFESKGAKVLVDAGRIAMIGTGRGTPMIAVCEPYNKEAPTPGNGVMVAFTAETKPEVDEFYARAIELGATCDGPPANGCRTVSMVHMCAISTATSCAFSSSPDKSAAVRVTRAADYRRDALCLKTTPLWQFHPGPQPSS